MSPADEFTGAYVPSWYNREVTLYRGDDVVDFGTVHELAQRRGVSEKYIYWLTTPTAVRRMEKSKNPNEHLIGVVTE